MKTIFISMIGLEERVLGAFQQGQYLADHYLLFVNKEFKEDERVVSYKKEIIEKHLSDKSFKFLEASYSNPFTINREFNRFSAEAGADFKKGRAPTGGL